jgi:hypothetical protein
MRAKKTMFRWIVICGVGVLPTLVMRCDKAALNLQRGFFQGLGLSLSDTLVEQGLVIQTDDDAQ